MTFFDSLFLAGRRLSTRSWIARSRRAVVSAARVKRPFSCVRDRAMGSSCAQVSWSLNPRAHGRVPPASAWPRGRSKRTPPVDLGDAGLARQGGNHRRHPRVARGRRIAQRESESATGAGGGERKAGGGDGETRFADPATDLVLARS